MSRLLFVLAAVVAVAFTVGLPAGSATSAGTWELIPAQSDTTGTPVTTYQTVVRPPINADGSSVFNAKRGVVPVQFDVLSGTTTPHIIGPVVFESMNGGNDPQSSSTGPYAWSGLFYGFASPIAFSDLTSLVATYNFTTGDCHGGSLRWTIYLTNGHLIHVYYGTPNGPDQGCSGAASGSGQNIITTGITPDRFEFQGAGAPVYTTHAAMLALTNNGADTVSGVGLILDSGWGGDQVIDGTTLAASVNGDAWVPKTPGTTYPFTDSSPTCNIPQAKIAITKTGGSNPGAVDEAQSIQPKDTGEFFRNVDCKLIYNLDVSTLTGTGSYEILADFGSGPVENPALFGLK